jgi:uncharacterized protein
VILIDANLLLYATVQQYPEHERANEWLAEQLNAAHKVAIAWPTIQAFVRIITNPRIFPSPLSSHAAVEKIEEWLSLDNVWTPLPTDRHLATLATLIRQTKASGNLISDAELAALAIQHGLELQSSDGDFARFKLLRWRNPLQD